MAKMEEQPKYVDILLNIDASYRAIKQVRPLSTSELRYFQEEFAIGASHNSNAIEGNTFTYDETRLLLKEGVASGDHSFLEHEEIVGYKQGFDFLYKAIKDRMLITEDFIKRLHTFVLRGEENGGKYRQIQNYIGDMFRVRFVPCAPSEVPGKMRAYSEKLQEDIALLSEEMKAEKISWLKIFHMLAAHHIDFERIHPFVDGNGRCGRLLLAYEFISIGLLPVDVRYEERARYYAALASYDDKKKYSSRPESKTEKMAKLLAESELRSMSVWLSIFGKIHP